MTNPLEPIITVDTSHIPTVEVPVNNPVSSLRNWISLGTSIAMGVLAGPEVQHYINGEPYNRASLILGILGVLSNSLNGILTTISKIGIVSKNKRIV